MSPRNRDTRWCRKAADMALSTTVGNMELWDTLARHARERPSAPALADRYAKLDYRATFDLLSRTRTAIVALGIGPGDTVLIRCHGLARPAILTLAIESVGASTACFSGDLARSGFGLLAPQARLLLHEGPFDGDTDVPRHRIDEAWWNEVSTMAPDAETPSALSEACVRRVISSSGTTGRPKLIAMTHEQNARRVETIHANFRYTTDSRFFSSIGLTFQGTILHMLACLEAGGCCLFDDAVPIWESLRNRSATHAGLLPAQLATLDGNARLPAGMTFGIYGARLSGAARTALQAASPDCRLVETYATNEVASVSLLDPDGLGELLPGAKAEIVDDADTVLPFGDEGIIRVRRPGMSTAYLFDEAASKDRFRDGWFYPGDLGIMPDARHLRVVARSDNVLNLEGLKLNADDQEARVREISGVADACFLTRPDASGATRLWLGVVLAEGADMGTVFPILDATLKPLMVPFSVFQLTSVPRTESGKAMRREIAKSLDDAGV